MVLKIQMVILNKIVQVKEDIEGYNKIHQILRLMIQDSIITIKVSFNYQSILIFMDLFN